MFNQNLQCLVSEEEMKDNPKVGIFIIVEMHNYRLSIGDDGKCVFLIYQEALGAEQTVQPFSNISFYPFSSCYASSHMYER